MRFIKASLLVLFFTVSGCGVTDRLDEVKPLINDFQALYNARSFSAMYEDMVHSELKDEKDLSSFAETLNEIRNLTGERISGKRTGFKWRSTAREGTTVVVTFESKFINGLGYETFTLKTDTDTLKLHGYNFKASEGFKANQADSA